MGITQICMEPDMSIGSQSSGAGAVCFCNILGVLKVLSTKPCPSNYHSWLYDISCVSL